MMRSTGAALAKKVAVVLSGCGVYDGAEIYEASSIYIHLSKMSAEVTTFAPNAPVGHVFDHNTGKVAEGETRNILTESARIARGPVLELDALKAADYDALLFPGGFGVMKNLSGFALGTGGVRDDVAAAIKDFHAAKKPIAAACIAPMLLASVLGKEAGGNGVLVTLGPASGDAFETARGFGNMVVPATVTDAIVDPANKIVTSPAYMDGEATPAMVFEGLGCMVDRMLELTKY